MLAQLPLSPHEPPACQRARVYTYVASLCGADRARQIEQSIFTRRGNYKAACLQVMRNISKRPDISDSLDADAIAGLSAAQWRQGTPAESTHAVIEKRRRHYEEVLTKGTHQVDKLQTKDRLLQCVRCKGVQIATEQRQTRSADEGMCVFASCLTCKAKWKM